VGALMTKRLPLESLCCLLALGACGGGTTRSSGGGAGARVVDFVPNANGGVASEGQASVSAGRGPGSGGGEVASMGVDAGNSGAGGPDTGASSSGGAGAAGASAVGDGGERAIAGAGGAAEPPAGAGASGEGGEPATCREWPDNCDIRCREPVGACLMDDEGRVAYGPTSLALEVIAATGDQPPYWDSWSCIGHLWYGEPVTTLTTMDGAGKAWTLAFSIRNLPSERFPIGSALDVEGLLFYKFQFEPTRALTIRQNGQTIAHFQDGPHEASVPDELGAAVATGGPACPWSLPDESGCSFNSLHTLARLGDATVLDPCDSQLGPFQVSSTFNGGRHLSECDGRYGACDAADRFLLSIVRRP
jgi:hypothetical protein